MRFRCKKCSTQYTIADEKVRGKVIKVRCKRCQNLIVIRSGAGDADEALPSTKKNLRKDANLELEFEQAFKSMYDSSAGPEPAQALDEEADGWYFGLDGAEDGPFSLADLQALAGTGGFTDQHFVWREGWTDWLPVEDVPELFGIVSPSGRITPPPLAPAEARRRQMERERSEAIRKRKQREEERRRKEEDARKRQAEDQRKRKAEEERKRKAEEDRKRKAEEDRKRKAEEDRKRKAEEDRKRKAEEERKRKAEEERKRKAPDDADKAKQDEERKLREEAPAKPEDVKPAPGAKDAPVDEDRRELLERVYDLRERVRADRKADRIADHFFTEDDQIPGEDVPLPPPPVNEPEQIAVKLHEESLREEYEDLQRDPVAVLLKREETGKSQESKVTKTLVAQAGVGAAGKSRKFLFMIFCLVGFLAVVGGGFYVASTQGWFSGKQSGRLARALEAAKKRAAEGKPVLPEQYSDLTEEERKKLMAALYEIEPKRRNGSRPTGIRQVTSIQPKMSKREKELMSVYTELGKEKKELTPRGPNGGLVSMRPMELEMPVTSVDPGAPLQPGAKIEVTPEAPRAGPQRLTDMQIRLVIQKNFRQVQSCHQRQLKRDETVSGLMYVTARVRPNGKVEKVQIKTKKFHGTFVEECLSKKIKRWEFPRFKGETYDVEFPLHLIARQGR